MSKSAKIIITIIVIVLATVITINFPSNDSTNSKMPVWLIIGTVIILTSVWNSKKNSKENK